MWYGIGWPCGTRRASNPSSCAAPGSGCTTHSQGKTVYRFQGGTMRETLAGSVCDVRNGAERCAFVGADSYSHFLRIHLLSFSSLTPHTEAASRCAYAYCPTSMRTRILSCVSRHLRVTHTSGSHSHHKCERLAGRYMGMPIAQQDTARHSKTPQDMPYIGMPMHRELHSPTPTHARSDAGR